MPHVFDVANRSVRRVEISCAHMRPWLPLALIICQVAVPPAPRGQAASPTVTVLRPGRVFDGEAMHEGWAVRVRGDHIDAVGPAATIDAAGGTVKDLPDPTLLPGLIESHSHVLLHPYNETTWND